MLHFKCIHEENMYIYIYPVYHFNLCFSLVSWKNIKYSPLGNAKTIKGTKIRMKLFIFPMKWQLMEEMRTLILFFLLPAPFGSSVQSIQYSNALPIINQPIGDDFIQLDFERLEERSLLHCFLLKKNIVFKICFQIVKNVVFRVRSYALSKVIEL